LNETDDRSFVIVVPKIKKLNADKTKGAQGSILAGSK